jgi:uncharacterized protein (TIGR02246 family)
VQLNELNDQEVSKMKRIILLFPLLLVISACSQTSGSADPSVITSRSEAWEAALNAKDLDALVALYTSDARVLPPNGKMVSGSDGVRAEFGSMIDAGLSNTLTSVEAMVSGDIAYNVGTYTLMAGDEQLDVGKYIETWRRGADGQWRISNDIYNSDLPVATEDAATAHLVILHEVDDAEHWLAAWRGEDSRHKLFKENGAAHVHTFQNADNPNVTGLVVSVSDMDALNAMLQSAEGQAAAAEDGVDMKSMIVLTEAD